MLHLRSSATMPKCSQLQNRSVTKQDDATLAIFVLTAQRERVQVSTGLGKTQCWHRHERTDLCQGRNIWAATTPAMTFLSHSPQQQPELNPEAPPSLNLQKNPSQHLASFVQCEKSGAGTEDNPHVYSGCYTSGPSEQHQNVRSQKDWGFGTPTVSAGVDADPSTHEQCQHVTWAFYFTLRNIAHLHPLCQKSTTLNRACTNFSIDVFSSVSTSFVTNSPRNPRKPSKPISLTLENRIVRTRGVGKMNILEADSAQQFSCRNEALVEWNSWNAINKFPHPCAGTESSHHFRVEIRHPFKRYVNPVPIETPCHKGKISLTMKEPSCWRTDSRTAQNAILDMKQFAPVIDTPMYTA